MAQPKNPALWRRLLKKHRATSEGSPPGRWSARKAILARREYEGQGGEWEGELFGNPRSGGKGKR